MNVHYWLLLKKNMIISSNFAMPSLFLRTKLDEGPFQSEQKAEVHRVWFGGT